MMAKSRWGLLIAGIFAVTASVEWLNGRVPICKCGYVKLWHGVVNSSENSQHIADWYTLSHIIHGFIFFGLGWLFLRKYSMGLRLVAATLIEVAWELFENSSFIINRYRTATISLDYFGDSILNSLSDTAFMILGFWLASRMPWKVTLVLAIAMELLAACMIRDNLALNIIMLIYPIQAIKDWQSGLIQ